MGKTQTNQKKEKINDILRGDIFLVSFDPTIGHEIKKTRPALVIQNNIGNQYNTVIIVAAITSKISPIPNPVEVVIESNSGNGLNNRSAIRLDQIRTVDRRRLLKFLGRTDGEIMAQVNQSLEISLGLAEL